MKPSPDPAPDLSPLWRCAHSPRPLLRAADFDPAGRAALTEAGLLRESEAAQETYCPSCVHDEQFVRVETETRADGTVRHYALCPECGVVDLWREDIERYAPDYDVLAGCLSHALEMAKPTTMRAPLNLWRLGQASFGRKTRHVWAVRAADELPREALPERGVVFTIGHTPAGTLPPDLVAIPVEDAVYWEDGLKVNRSVCEAHFPDGGAASSKPAAARKRDAMTRLIGQLACELKDHILAQRDQGNHCLREGIAWTLSPPPTQRFLAVKLNTSLASVNRALNDPDARMLPYLMAIAGDEEKVLTFRA